MRKTIEVALATVAVALFLAKAAAAPAAGTWEGKLDGRKAVTLTVKESDGRLSGHATFYVVDKKFGDPDAQVVGELEHDLSDVIWDGKALRFSIHDPDVAFEMTITGVNLAVLKRLTGENAPEATVSLQRN